jgi:Cft2 family RNA processing exonuclease
VQIGNHSVLIDCGIAVGARSHEDQIPDLSAVPRLDALLVTHAHTDHVGWIPALVGAMDDFPIHCTAPTAELLPIMLRDSRGHYERWLAAEQVKQRHNAYAPVVREEYTRDDVADALLRLSEARVGEITGVGATDLQATFFPAGHILGAASILLEGGGRRVVLSGDISSEFQQTVNPFSVPDDLGDIDLLVLESTYGYRRRSPLSGAQRDLVDFVKSTVPQGIALLPCFALGRAQEVVAILKSARRAGELPRELVIFTDGMINKINPVYAAHTQLEEADCVPIVEQIDRDVAIQSATAATPTPTVVVTTSGMLTGGPVVEWARRLLPDARHRMALLGYQDEGAPGGLLRKIADRRPPYPITLRGEDDEPIEVQVASRVVELGLSAHADQDGLVKYAKCIDARKIVLVHGDDDARSMLRERLLHEGICRDVDLARTTEVR